MRKRDNGSAGSERGCIVVLGMHRSGTSTLTRMLSLMGATLPKRLMGRGEGNETGHWEPQRLVDYHDQMLSELGSAWHDWRPLDLKALPVSRRATMKADIGEILHEDFGDAPLIVVKDPRICRFASFFCQSATEAGYEVKLVLAFRNPLEVMDSILARKSAWPPDHDELDAALLWLIHNLEAEKASRSYPRAVISYDRLMSDWEKPLSGAAQTLGYPFSSLPGDVKADISAFVDEGHRHHAKKPEDVLLDPRTAGWIADCHVALTTLETGRDVNRAMAELDRIGAEFSGALPLLRQAVELRRNEAARKGELEVSLTRVRAEAEEKAAIYDEHAAVLERERDDNRARADALASQIAAAGTRIAQIEEMAREADSLRKAAEEGAARDKAAAQAAVARFSQAQAEIADLRREISAREKLLGDERRVAARLHAQLTEEIEVERAEKLAREQQVVSLEELLAGQRAQSEAQLDALKKAEAEKDARIAALESGNRDAQARIEHLEGKAGEKAERISGLERDVTEKAEQIAGLERDIELRIRETEAAHAQLHQVASEFQNSTSWKLTAPLRAIKVGPRALVRPANATIDLMAEARSRDDINLEVDDGRHVPTTRDPQIVLTLEKPLRPGWYHAEAVIEVDGSCAPRIYFDLGKGFSEQFAVAMNPCEGSHRYQSFFFIPESVSIVRFDPVDALVPFQLNTFRFKPIRGVRKIGWLSGMGLRQLRISPSKLLQRVRRYRAIGRDRRFADVTNGAGQTKSTDYESWISRFDYDDSRDRRTLNEKLSALPERPMISILMPVYNTPAKLLDEAIRSVVGQVYPDWELCIANDASTASHIRSQLDRWAAKDTRIKVVHRQENGHICHATNSAFELASGAWIALLDHDDVLRPHALAEVALALNEHPDASLLYSDEDKIDEKRARFSPHFKCDYSPELFHSMNYLNHLTVHRADLIRAVGGWRPGFEGSQDYDLNLRITEKVDPASILHIPKILYHWRAVKGSTALAGSEKDYPFQAGFRALEEHLQRTGQDAKVMEVPGLPFYRIRHAIRNPAPPVSLILPTRDRIDLLRVAVQSILEKTDYPDYEIIIVDNNSAEPETFAYFDEIGSHENVRILPYPGAFNYSAINNEAVRHAEGEIIGLINNDIEVINGDWLSEMVSWAQQERVGCVGAKLYYPDDTIQHAGVILGIGGVASHAHKHKHRNDPGYFGRANVVQNYSAVTAACLLVRKSVFQAVGGLDEQNLKVAFNDVDLCLKVREAGYDNVWTPFAELYHHESPSRGLEDTPEKQERFAKEVDYMMDRWSKVLNADPYYSPNLTKNHDNFLILYI